MSTMLQVKIFLHAVSTIQKSVIENQKLTVNFFRYFFKKGLHEVLLEIFYESIQFLNVESMYIMFLIALI